MSQCKIVSVKCLSGYESCMRGWDHLEFYKPKSHVLIFLLVQLLVLLSENYVIPIGTC